jgi:hypothetical protein
MPGRESAKGLFVFLQHRAHDPGIVRPAIFRVAIRDQVKLPVGIDQGESGAGHRVVGNLLIRALGKILDDIRQELQLIHQMRIGRSLDLRELDLEKGSFLCTPFRMRGVICEAPRRTNMAISDMAAFWPNPNAPDKPRSRLAKGRYRRERPGVSRLRIS